MSNKLAEKPEVTAQPTHFAVIMAGGLVRILTWAGFASLLGSSAIHGATGKATPVDADELALSDSAAANVLKKLTWANLKATLKGFFDGLYAGLSHAHAIDDTTGLQGELDAKAPLDSPTFTGTPLAPTATPGTNTTQVATTAFAMTAAANAAAALVDSSPSTLNTLNELAAALNDDPNFATTMTAAIGAKAPLASPALTGTPTAPTQTEGDNSTAIATTAFVAQAVAAAAGGNAILRGTGELTGYDEAPVLPAGAVQTIDLSAWNPSELVGDILLLLNDGGYANYYLSFSTSDPSTSPPMTNWVDTSSEDAATVANNIASVLNGALSPYFRDVSVVGSQVQFETVTTGSAVTLEVDSNISSIPDGAQTAGVDGTPGSGGVSSIELIPLEGGKKFLPTRIESYVPGGALGTTVEVGFLDGGDAFTLLGTFNGAVSQQMAMGVNYPAWLDGIAEAALVARYTGEPGVGNAFRIIAVAESASV